VAEVGIDVNGAGDVFRLHRRLDLVELDPRDSLILRTGQDEHGRDLEARFHRHEAGDRDDGPDIRVARGAVKRERDSHGEAEEADPLAVHEGASDPAAGRERDRVVDDLEPLRRASLAVEIVGDQDGKFPRRHLPGDPLEHLARRLLKAPRAVQQEDQGTLAPGRRREALDGNQRAAAVELLDGLADGGDGRPWHSRDQVQEQCRVWCGRRRTRMPSSHRACLFEVLWSRTERAEDG
jgi:hypothetical protein